MRTRTEKEKEAMGMLNTVFRELSIKKGTRGYLPVMDMICYAYAYPEQKFSEIIKILSKENFYVGVKQTRTVEEIEAKVQEVCKQAMREAIEKCKTVEETQEFVECKIQKAEAVLAEEAKFSLLPSMRRSIATALEGTPKELLAKYGLEKLSIILEDGNPIERAKIEEKLLEDLGEKYSEYETYEERVIVFFAKKILKYITTQTGPASI